MRETLALSRKELNSYFSSPLAVIFVGVFLAATLALFFWVEKFWARGIADVRPLFEWLPVVMIFLAAALTMRQWSEEQQSGTLEILLILPVRLWQLVVGKFLAVLGLVAIALAFTLVLPLSISSLGDLDWGPVLGGYVASILLAAAYISIGLFISSLTNNQIVSLIMTVLVAGALYLIGSPLLTNQINDSSVNEIMRAIGSGSRFESIERGVIDLRDLVYFVSVSAIFLTLNVLSLDKKRWASGSSTEAYRFNASTGATLIAANLLIVNALLYPVTSFRADLTEYKEYSLSDITRETVKNLDEPLLITGYFSEKNYPPIEPLLPILRDTLEEYQIASDGKIELEWLDPISDPEREEEANQTYGIQPLTLSVEERTGVNIVNAYMQILIRYGDQSSVVSLGELIEADPTSTQEKYRFRNLEYDLTSTIRKVVSGFQSVDAMLESLDEPAQLTLYYTPDTLPSSWTEAPATIEKVVNELNRSGNLVYVARDVNAENLDPQQLYDSYGVRPLQTIGSPDIFYMDLVLEAEGNIVAISPTGDFSEAAIRSNIEAALKRVAPGFLSVVGIWTPPDVPQTDMYGQQIPSLAQYSNIVAGLQGENEVQTVDLSTGQVPTNVDLLIVIAPQSMTELERYAIDQYLMRGGTVFVAAGNYKLTADQFSQWISLQAVTDGLQEMLASYGVSVGQELVMDTQNAPFGAIITGGTQDIIDVIPYPFLVDVRQEGMDQDSGMMSNLASLVVSWASPITVDGDLNADREVTTLLRSSKNAWLRASSSLNASFQYTDTYYLVEGERKAYPLGVVIEGVFTSYFADKPSPFEGQAEDASIPAFLSESSDSARLVVIGSGEFLNDNMFAILGSIGQDRYTNTLQFMQNAVDWSVQDTALSAIRTRGTSTRLLESLDDKERRGWEILNYGAALVALLALSITYWLRKRAEEPMPLVGVGDLASDAQ